MFGLFKRSAYDFPAADVVAASSRGAHSSKEQKRLIKIERDLGRLRSRVLGVLKKMAKDEWTFENVSCREWKCKESSGPIYEPEAIEVVMRELRAKGYAVEFFNREGDCLQVSTKEYQDDFTK